MPLPSSGGFHSSSPQNVTTDTIQRERSTYLGREKLKMCLSHSSLPYISNKHRVVKSGQPLREG